jgi:hypothetical protein
MKREHQFAICVQNGCFAGTWKIYRSSPTKAAQHQLMRIVDETSEDYSSMKKFVPIKLPPQQKQCWRRHKWGIRTMNTVAPAMDLFHF